MFDIPSFCRTFKKDLDIFGGTLKKETGGRDQETEVRGQDRLCMCGSYMVCCYQDRTQKCWTSVPATDKNCRQVVRELTGPFTIVLTTH